MRTLPLCLAAAFAAIFAGTVQAADPYLLDPVSYTHLTLPTIYSV